jgi:hypothetical protein
MKMLFRLAAVVVPFIACSCGGNCSKEIYYYAFLRNTLREPVTVRYWSVGQQDTTETRTILGSNESRWVYMRTVKQSQTAKYPLDLCTDSETTFDAIEFNADTYNQYTICQIFWIYEIRAYGESCS